jgi:hypothetical protein
MEKDLEKKLYLDTKYNVKGDIEKQSFFMDSDENGTLFNQCLEKMFVIARNNKTGIPLNQTIVSKTIKGDEITQTETQTIHFTLKRGMEINQESRNQLIMESQNQFLIDLLKDYTPEQSLIYGKQLIDDSSMQREKYILGSIEPLIDFINNYNETFMNQTRKNLLISILNVTY